MFSSRCQFNAIRLQVFGRRLTSDAVTPKITSIDQQQRAVNIRWDDDKQGNFPYIWLRENSHDPNTITKTKALTARKLRLSQITPDIQPQNISLSENGNGLTIDWPDGQISEYSSQFMRIRNLDDPDVHRHRRAHALEDRQTWDASELLKKVESIDFNDAVNDAAALHQWLLNVVVFGFGKLHGAPVTEDTIEIIGNQMIGLIHDTHYGRRWSVEVRSDPMNPAYAHREGLPLHTDDPALKHPPELQLLHCVRSAQKGGATTFVDGFHVAKQLKRTNPKAYDILLRIPFESVEEGYEKFGPPNEREFTFKFAARHTVISEDVDGQPSCIRYSSHMRSWYWQVNAFHQLHDVYDAWYAWEKLLYSEKHLTPIQLKPGDVVLWANDRLLHGRNSYMSANQQLDRRLDGCYFAWDHVRSRIREIRTRINMDARQESM